MPELKKYYEENRSDDRFVILAFHDGTVKTFEELDEKCQAPKAKYWDGEDLPFPVLLDSTGKTIKQFDISGFPTMILFDPQGRLVGYARLDTLKEALEGKVTTPEPLKVNRPTGERETGNGG